MRNRPEYSTAKNKVEKMFRASGQMDDGMGLQLVLRKACNETLWPKVKFTNIDTNLYEKGIVYKVLQEGGILQGGWLSASTWQSEVVPIVDKQIANKRSSTNSMMKDAFMGECLACGKCCYCGASGSTKQLTD